jgi:hypothetical protein
MSCSRRIEEGSESKILLFFLIALPRTLESLKIFKVTVLCHIAVKVEEYKN